jgi:hypothetical protein
MSRLDDSALAVLAASGKKSHAEQVPILRHHAWAGRQIRWPARERQLRWTDTEDACTSRLAFTQ